MQALMGPGMVVERRKFLDDAIQVLDTSDGVVKSTTANKMNEINPHRSWAKKIKSGLEQTLWQSKKAFG